MTMRWGLEIRRAQSLTRLSRTVLDGRAGSSQRLIEMDRTADPLKVSGDRRECRPIHTDRRGEVCGKPRGNGSSPRGPRGTGVAGLFVVPRLEELAVDPSKGWGARHAHGANRGDSSTGHIHGILLPIARSRRDRQSQRRGRPGGGVAERTIEQFQVARARRRCKR